MPLVPFIRTIALDHAALHRGSFEERCFDPCEGAAALRLQTLAGLLCDKKAIAAGCCARGRQTAFDIKKIILRHDENGAPAIVSLPPEFTPQHRHIAVSLSHTARFACGCAVFAKALDNG